MAKERERLDGLIRALLGNTSCQLRVSVADASYLATSARDLLLREETLLNLHPPLNICGDIHGQFPDLLRIFEMAETPPNAKFLFLGDYVDRGPMSVEVICLLFAMKLRYPNHVFLIRGNHETREMTEQYGFAAECQSKLNRQCLAEFCEAFDALPIAALIGNSIFCVHGGLSPTLESLDQVRAIARPADASYKGFLADLLWSDPNPEIEGFTPSDRGDTVFWGPDAATRFLAANGLSTIVRAHQLVHMGYEWPFGDQSALTVFSAPCYAGEYKNRGAFVNVDRDLVIEPVVLPHEPGSMRGANRVRAETPRGKPKEKKGKERKGKEKKGKRK
jgi:serine/threonine-protein phosphatase PP1 catalytic subunit